MINKIVNLIEYTVCKVPGDVEDALKKAYENETDETARFQLENILKNLEIAKRESIPLCQDTGLPIFYILIGKDVDNFNLVVDLENKIRDAVELVTERGMLRPNVVDPITRENKGNVGDKVPIIHHEIVEGTGVEIIFLPKGSGSENMSRLTMLNPTGGIKSIKRFVLDTVNIAGGNPCPPTIIGVGIGGNFDSVAGLAKKALLRPINKRSSIPKIAKLEENLYNEINNLGIGPMGLGGKTTTLGVNIETGDTHTAMLPLAVNIQCWAARQGSLVIK